MSRATVAIDAEIAEARAREEKARAERKERNYGECSRHTRYACAWGRGCWRCETDREAERRAAEVEARKRARIVALAEPHHWRVAEIADVTGWPWQYVQHVLTEHRREIVQRAMAPRDLWPPSNCH